MAKWKKLEMRLSSSAGAPSHDKQMWNTEHDWTYEHPGVVVKQYN